MVERTTIKTTVTGVTAEQTALLEKAVRQGEKITFFVNEKFSVLITKEEDNRGITGSYVSVMENSKLKTKRKESNPIRKALQKIGWHAEDNKLNPAFALTFGEFSEPCRCKAQCHDYFGCPKCDDPLSFINGCEYKNPLCKSETCIFPNKKENKNIISVPFIKRQNGKTKLVDFTFPCNLGHKAKHYAKEVEGIDTTKKNGYAILGNFLNKYHDYEMTAGNFVMWACGNDLGFGKMNDALAVLVEGDRTEFLEFKNAILKKLKN